MHYLQVGGDGADDGGTVTTERQDIAYPGILGPDVEVVGRLGSESNRLAAINRGRNIARHSDNSCV